MLEYGSLGEGTVLEYSSSSNSCGISTSHFSGSCYSFTPSSTMFDSVDLASLLPRFNTSSSISNNDNTESLLPSSSSTTTTSNNENEQGGESFFPALTWKERMIGCAACMILGYLLSFGSFFRLKDLMTGNPLPFVLNATIGNIIALAGSCFLTGPKKQISSMCSKSRQVASIAYIVSLVLTLVVAFVPFIPAKGVLLLILLIVQYLAIFWYCLSYVPFARDAVRAYFTRMVGTSSEE